MVPTTTRTRAATTPAGGAGARARPRRTRPCAGRSSSASSPSTSPRSPSGRVWRPDALGSICFLVSGAIAYRASTRRGWLPLRGKSGWWEASVNLLGCVFFGVSAIAGYVVPSSGSELDLAAANWNTAAGAACFLACALATFRSGRTSKARRPRRLDELAGA